MKLHSASGKIFVLAVYFQALTAEAFLSRSKSITTRDFSTTARFVLQERLSSEEIHSRLESQLTKLREKDRASKAISPGVSRVITSNSVGWLSCRTFFSLGYHIHRRLNFISLGSKSHPRG